MSRIRSRCYEARRDIPAARSSGTRQPTGLRRAGWRLGAGVCHGRDMTLPGADDAHDARLVELLGVDAEEVLARQAAYPPLRADLVEAALSEGKTCRVKVRAARILAYRAGDGAVRAVVTELPHSGYRRRYRVFEAPDGADLVRQLLSEYE